MTLLNWFSNGGVVSSDPNVDGPMKGKTPWSTAATPAPSHDPVVIAAPPIPTPPPAPAFAPPPLPDFHLPPMPVFTLPPAPPPLPPIDPAILAMLAQAGSFNFVSTPLPAHLRSWDVPDPTVTLAVP